MKLPRPLWLLMLDRRHKRVERRIQTSRLDDATARALESAKRQYEFAYEVILKD